MLLQFMARPINRKLQERIRQLREQGIKIPKIAQELSRRRREYISPQRVSFYIQKTKYEEEQMTKLSRMNN
jgi:orotate phosphoribosyltransferase-like protein